MAETTKTTGFGRDMAAVLLLVAVYAALGVGMGFALVNLPLWPALALGTVFVGGLLVVMRPAYRDLPRSEGR
jgi:hypothetical protein